MAPRSSLTEEQMRFWYRRGKEQGAKQHAAVYNCCCEKHHARLLPTAPGVYECLFCQLAAREQAQPTLPPPTHVKPEPLERQTDALPPIPTNRFLLWRLEQHQDTGQETEQHRAIRWKK